jgi:hypothetical protein
MNQESLRSRLFIELDCVTLDAKKVAGDLTPSQLAWQPPGGLWSVAQVFEHLVIVDDLYLGVMRPLIYARNAAHADGGSASWEPSMMGWMLVASLRSQRKLPAPTLYQVTTPPRDAVLDAFKSRQHVITTFLRAASALDWTRVRFSSPAGRWIRLNLGDAFMILTVHAQRHVKQMEAVRDMAGFPKR